MAKKVYFENLDGLRFLCFLSVFFFHSFHTDYDYIKASEVYVFVKRDLFGNGNIGVNFFFVLSGFLITYLLIAEKKLTGHINLPYFWTRRILRIWPLFYSCVIFGFYMFPLLKASFGEMPNETASLAYYLLFLNNFDFIKSGLPDASTLGVLWSVAIEEQFYLIWPIILVFLPIKRFWIAFAGIIICSLTFRLLNQSPVLYEYHTLSCIGDMAIGAFGAWLVTESHRFKQRIEKLERGWIAFIYISLAVCFLFRDDVLAGNNLLVTVTERVIIAVVILFVILEQNYSENSFFKMSRARWCSTLGRMSYGLYCLHFVGILIATTLTRITGLNTELWQVMILETTIALLITVALSAFSYAFFEKRFLELKERFVLVTTKEAPSNLIS